MQVNEGDSQSLPTPLPQVHSDPSYIHDLHIHPKDPAWTYSAHYNGFQQIPIETFMPYPKTRAKIRIHVIDTMTGNGTYG